MELHPITPEMNFGLELPLVNSTFQNRLTELLPMEIYPEMHVGFCGMKAMGLNKPCIPIAGL